MFKTNLSKSVFGFFAVLGLFVLSACSGAGNAVTESTATQEVTQIVETPTFLPTVTPEPTATVAIVLDPEVVGPVEMTGEEYKLLHAQNVIDKKGTMCSPEIYAARNELVIVLRQRTMDKLAAETVETVPENTFEAYLAWLYKLKASGKIDNDKFWEYAGNILLTNEEISKLAMAEGPINKSIEQPNNVTPGINFGKEEVSVPVTLPDGNTREQKIFDFAQGKVLAMVPSDLIPGESVDIRGKIYVIFGGNDNVSISIAVMTYGAFSGELAGGYFDNGKLMEKMPQKWQGYYIPSYESITGTQYFDIKNFYNWGAPSYQGGQMIKVTPGNFEESWVRLAFLHRLNHWMLDQNGVVMPRGETVMLWHK